MADPTYGTGPYGVGPYGTGRAPIVHDVGAVTRVQLIPYTNVAFLHEVGAVALLELDLTAELVKAWAEMAPCLAGAWSKVQ